MTAGPSPSRPYSGGESVCDGQRRGRHTLEQGSHGGGALIAISAYALLGKPHMPSRRRCSESSEGSRAAGVHKGRRADGGFPVSFLASISF
jgi:hypothetical protein